MLIIPAGFTLAADGKNDLNLNLLQQPNNLDALVARQAVGQAAQQVGSIAQIAGSSGPETGVSAASLSSARNVLRRMS